MGLRVCWCKFLIILVICLVMILSDYWNWELSLRLLFFVFLCMFMRFWRLNWNRLRNWSLFLFCLFLWLMKLLIGFVRNDGSFIFWSLIVSGICMEVSLRFSYVISLFSVLLYESVLIGCVVKLSFGVIVIRFLCSSLFVWMLVVIILFIFFCMVLLLLIWVISKEMLFLILLISWMSFFW